MDGIRAFTRHHNRLGTQADVSAYGYVDADPMSRVDPADLQSVVTCQNLGATVYYDNNGNFVESRDSLSTVASKSKAGAAGPYQSADVYPTNGPYYNRLNAYGPNDIPKTDDHRDRWIHRGRSKLKDPLAPRQGWTPAVGCTRMQNGNTQ
jgi:hypothetical protein